MQQDLESREHELLAIRCQLGELGAFDELVARWHGPLWHYVRRMADRNDLADELTQETWLRILRGMANLREPASLVAWMFGIARRVLMNRFREKYKDSNRVDEVVDLEATQADADKIDQQNEITDLLHKLEFLPVQQREILTLYYLDELSTEQVGQILGIPPGTVKSRLYHARNLLRQLLGDTE